MTVNIAVIAGNLTRDVESKATASGHDVAHFTVAVNNREKVNGEWTDVASFIDVTAFGGTAKYVAGQHKGARMTVQGRLKQSSWTDKDGNKRSRIEIIAAEVVLPPKSEGGSAPRVEAVRHELGATYADDEEIPF